jgi:hypothetical protein
MGKARDKQRLRRHIQEMRLEHKIEKTTLHYEEMQALCREYDCADEALFCGYLRQPIDVARRDNGCYVLGCCALSDNYQCKRFVPSGSNSHAYDICHKYLSLFGSQKPTAKEER